MRRGFYAGLQANLMLLEALGDDNLPEEAGMQILNDFRGEVRAFWAKEAGDS